MSHYSSSSSSSSSSATSPTDGMAINWVLDHVLTHPDSYQATLPLRTIYTLNCQTVSTPTDFKLMLMEYLQNKPVQPCTLPPVFLTTFIKKCFPKNFEGVDFDQVLTALDYLRDLEFRRKKELEKAIRANSPYDKRVITMRERSAKLDQVYAKALVGIRRWTLINELSLPRFNKCNCVALLNTLYPLEEEDINSYLTAPVLLQQRQALWKYITGVERNGPTILDTVRYTNGGWENISDAIYLYSRLSLDMIRRAEDLARPTSYGSFQSDSSVELDPSSPKQVAAPSGRDFGRRDSTNDSSESEFESGKRSRLEKIVRGLSKLSGSGSSKKTYGADWNTKKGFRVDCNASNDDVKMRYG